MVSVLLGAAAISTALAGGYGLYRYWAGRAGHATLSDSEEPVNTQTESAQLTAVESRPQESTRVNTAKPIGDEGMVAETVSEEILPVAPTPPSKRSPEVPPKPLKKHLPAVPPKPSPKPVGSRGLAPAIPLGFASELQAKLQTRARADDTTLTLNSEADPLVISGLSAESAISFDQPVKLPNLISPSRNKGPANRRPPTRHGQS